MANDDDVKVSCCGFFGKKGKAKTEEKIKSQDAQLPGTDAVKEKLNENLHEPPPTNLVVVTTSDTKDAVHIPTKEAETVQASSAQLPSTTSNAVNSPATPAISSTSVTTTASTELAASTSPNIPQTSLHGASNTTASIAPSTTITDLGLNATTSIPTGELSVPTVSSLLPTPAGSNAVPLPPTRAGTFSVGDKVQAQFRDGRWYSATISAVHADKSYLVDWDNGNTEDRTKTISSLRRDPKYFTSAAPPPPPGESAAPPHQPAAPPAAAEPAKGTTAAAAAKAVPPRFKVGDAVMGQFRDGRWYPAKVAEVREDRSYVLAWGSGQTEDCVKGEASLRRASPPPTDRTASEPPKA